MTPRKLESVNVRTEHQPATTSGSPGDAIECGPVWLSPHEMCELRVRGHRVPMSETQLHMLASLIGAEGKIISRDELLAGGAVNGAPGSSSRAVDIHISRMRVALGPLGRHIIAVRGRGYRIDVRGLARAR